MTDSTRVGKGWHPDPSGEPRERYWDGEQWTSETRPYPAPTAPSPTRPTPVPERSAGSPSSAGRTVAIGALVVLALAGVVAGLVAWRHSVDENARKEAEKGSQVGGPTMSEVYDLFCPEGPFTDTTGTGIDCSEPR